jgi:hypothetical protein
VTFPLRVLGVVSTTTLVFSIAILHLQHCLLLTNETRDDRTLLTSSAGLENAKKLVTAYKTGKISEMTPELWNAKKIIDSTIHPGTTIGAMMARRGQGR